jgi:CRP/FNR family transcriptional regulator
MGREVDLRGNQGQNGGRLVEGKEGAVPTALLGHRGDAFAVVASARPIILERRQLPEPCAHCGARGYSVCGAIADDDLGPLAALAVVTEVDAGRTFIEEGDSAESFFNVTSGTAKLYKLLPDGRRQITGFAGPGHFLGLAVSSIYAFSAEAIDPVRFCRFSRPKLRKLLIDFPKLEQRLLEVAANELVAAQEQMLLLGRKTARERLASFLLMQTGQGTSCGGRGERITLPMTRGDIADYLGLTIETVSRTLSRLRAEQMIDIPNTSDVVILNCAALENLAGGLS